MTLQNREMTLKVRELTGIKTVNAKYIKDGSLRGTWRLWDSSRTVKIWGNTELQDKLNTTFIDFTGEPISNISGNGGMFSLFVRTK